MRAVALEELRAQVRALEGGAPVQRRRDPSGVEVVDQLIGGLPRPGIVEICGAVGSGRMRLVAALVARSTARHRAVAWVDPLRRLYPPALAAMGIPLRQILLVRPPEDGSQPWLWAAEQLLRSGCFELVVVDRPDGPSEGLPRRPVGAKWARAAEHGQSTALVLGERPSKQLAADVRLSVGKGRVMALRDRGGPHLGGMGPLPPWALPSDPWGG
jgi:hypothetical protein